MYENVPWNIDFSLSIFEKISFFQILSLEEENIIGEPSARIIFGSRIFVRGIARVARRKNRTRHKSGRLSFRQPLVSRNSLEFVRGVVLLHFVGEANIEFLFFSFLFFRIYINHSNCLRKRKEGEEKSRCNIVNVPSLESKFKKKLNDLEFFLYFLYLEKTFFEAFGILDWTPKKEKRKERRKMKQKVIKMGEFFHPSHFHFLTTHLNYLLFFVNLTCLCEYGY